MTSFGPRVAVIAGVASLLLWASSGPPANGELFPGERPVSDLGSTDQAEGNRAWSPGFNRPDVNGWVRAIVEYDDGSGPSLVVAGLFRAAGGEVAQQVARWDGSAWSPLSGPAANGIEAGSVDVLAAFDDGAGPAVFAGGSFHHAGGVPAHYLARWDRNGWSALSPGPYTLPGRVRALAAFDDANGPALYVAGEFTTVAEIVTHGIVRWDGATWSPLTGPAGDGVTGGAVYALAAYDDGTGPALYAAGSFTSAGGVTANRIARWDGRRWHPLVGPSGNGVAGGYVHALAVYDDGNGPALYAGGSFTSAGGVTALRVARWDGTAWSRAGWWGPAHTVTSMAVADDEAAGRALFVNSESAVLRWDGSQWSLVENGFDPGQVNVVAAADDGRGPALYAGGSFAFVGGVPFGGIARRRNGGWEVLSGRGHGLTVGENWPGTVEALEVFDDGSGRALYAGGWFTAAGRTKASSIARWNGVSWSSLPGHGDEGVDDLVRALKGFADADGPALYVAGEFDQAGGTAAASIARWDGSSWSALGGGVSSDGQVNALEVYDDGSGPALFVGGTFSTAGGVTVHGLAKWNGSSWSAVTDFTGAGALGGVGPLAVFDDGTGPALFIGGPYRAGGMTVNGIVKYDGSMWWSLSGPAGTGVSGLVEALAVYDDGSGPALYVGGGFETAGGVVVSSIARWDGSAWSALSGPSGVGVDRNVEALAVYDEGTGPALYATGDFTSAGGIAASDIARWDGSTWSALEGPAGNGLGPITDFGGEGGKALAVFADRQGQSLYVGGDFELAGGLVSESIARWRNAPLVFVDGFETGGTAVWSSTVVP